MEAFQGIYDCGVVEAKTARHLNGVAIVNMVLINDINPLAWNEILHQLPLRVFLVPNAIVGNISGILEAISLCNDILPTNRFGLMAHSLAATLSSRTLRKSIAYNGRVML